LPAWQAILADPRHHVGDARHEPAYGVLAAAAIVARRFSRRRWMIHRTRLNAILISAAGKRFRPDLRTVVLRWKWPRYGWLTSRPASWSLGRD
jgi:hypothetical protein